MVLAEAVHDGLRNISPSVPPIVLSYMNKRASNRSDRCIDDPEAFDEGLREIFGFGAKVIEKVILEALYRKLRAPKEVSPDFNFVEEVKYAKRLFDACA
jgi:hypothetical protein